MTAERTAELRGGWWGFSGFQATGMIKWGQISKPKKVPRASNKTQKTPWTLNNPKKSHAKFLSLKNIFGKESKFGCTLIAEQCGWDMQALSWIFRLFWIAKKISTYQATPKNTCQIFLPQKIPESKISDPKKICQLSLLLEIQCTPPPFQGCRVFGKKNFTGLLDITSTRNCIIYKKSLH